VADLSHAAAGPAAGDAHAVRWPGSNVRSVEFVRQVSIAFAIPDALHEVVARYALELSRHMTIRDVADHLGVGWDLIKEIQKADLQRRFQRCR